MMIILIIKSSISHEKDYGREKIIILDLTDCK